VAAMCPQLTDERIREVNVRYHDHAASHYDAKWGIDFGEVGRAQVLGKLRKLLGEELDRGLGRSLEVGAGTGYFTLNLLAAGLVARATATDISPGMLRALRANARRLHVKVSTRTAEAGALPFADGSFDVVLGHAVLHHLPDLPRAFREFHRVLAPGGRILFAGEPSRLGDRLAAAPKRAAVLAAPAWRRLVGARPAAAAAPAQDRSADGAHALEALVDVRTFSPAELERHARLAGFREICVRGEELTASWFGWFNRALEASAEPADVPIPWRRFAFEGYLALQRLDRALLEPLLPAGAFYNLLLSARRP